MAIQCDTLRLVPGRPGPFVTSTRFIAAADVREIKHESGLVAGAGARDAGVGLVTGSGRRVILRRMPTGNEVRGLLPSAPYAHADAIELLADSAFWAGSSFESAKAVRAPLRDGEAPERWHHPLHGGSTDRDDRREAGSRRAETRLPAPRWILHACVAAAAAGVLFMAVSIGVAWLRAEAGASHRTPGGGRP